MIPGCAHADAAICQAETCRWPACVPNATQKLRACTKCLTAETADTITYDAQGVCSVCRQHEVKHHVIDWEQRRRDLDVLADEARGSGTYDCILPFSGGKDSTFQLWFLITQLNLKPLVVRVNHHFYRPQVQANVVEAQRQLGFDLLEFTPNWKVWRAVMLEAFRRRGDSCWPCHCSIFSYPMKVAIEKQIPLIVWGESLAEYQSFNTFDEMEQVDGKRFNRATNLGITADDMYEFLGQTIPRRDLEPFSYPPRKDLVKLGVKSLCLGNYIKWDTRANVEIIKRECGWKGAPVEGVPPQFDYEKIECKSQGFRDHQRFMKRGQGRSSHLANIEIRQGRMSREDGVALAETYDGKEPASLGYMLGLMGISREEYYETIQKHAVDPWRPNPGNMEQGPALPDMAEWK